MKKEQQHHPSPDTPKESDVRHHTDKQKQQQPSVNEKDKKNKLTFDDLRGKKVDGDPEKTEDQPLQQ